MESFSFYSSFLSNNVTIAMELNARLGRNILWKIQSKNLVQKEPDAAIKIESISCVCSQYLIVWLAETYHACVLSILLYGRLRRIMLVFSVSYCMVGRHASCVCSLYLIVWSAETHHACVLCILLYGWQRRIMHVFSVSYCMVGRDVSCVCSQYLIVWSADTYRACVLSILLYGWQRRIMRVFPVSHCIVGRDVDNLSPIGVDTKQFHLRCLSTIFGLKWQKKESYQP